MKKERNFWTKEKCREEALKYKTKEEFREKSRYAYVTSFKHLWLDDICSHMMVSNIKPIGYWSKERCKLVALKHKNRNDFRINNKSAYVACLRHKWLDDVCSHLKGYKSHGFWTKNNCKKEALKYNTRLDFQKGSMWAYRISLKNDWMDDICSHMKSVGNLYKRCIYAYEFSDNYAYIGLTFNIDKRNEIHMKKGIVSKYIQNNSNYILKQLSEYIDVDEAKKLEGSILKQYKKNGWIILNKSKTGGLGGRKFWTKDKCQKLSLKYENKKDFYVNCPNAYKSSIRYGWLSDICSHMVQNKKPIGYWTKEKCQEEALKYINKKDFRRNSINYYSACVRNKWLDEVCSHMMKKIINVGKF